MLDLFDLFHAKCTCISINESKSIQANTIYEWTCLRRVLTELSFHSCADMKDSNGSVYSCLNEESDPHLDALKSKETQLKIMHVNTLSMITTFDNLLITVNHYSFDVITMSKTWLKENNVLLQHVTIPGYAQAFNNRHMTRVGGVGIYLKESIKFQYRPDLEKKYPGMEHLWLEISGSKDIASCYWALFIARK